MTGCIILVSKTLLSLFFRSKNHVISSEFVPILKWSNVPEPFFIQLWVYSNMWARRCVFDSHVQSEKTVIPLASAWRKVFVLLDFQLYLFYFILLCTPWYWKLVPHMSIHKHTNVLGVITHAWSLNGNICYLLNNTARELKSFIGPHCCYPHHALKKPTQTSAHERLPHVGAHRSSSCEYTRRRGSEALLSSQHLTLKPQSFIKLRTRPECAVTYVERLHKHKVMKH